MYIIAIAIINQNQISIMFSQEILKGIIKPLIIKMVKDNGRMYGYQITQQVKAMSDGNIHLTEGALYPALHRLEKEGILTVEAELTGSRLRKYYSLSESGQQTSVSKLDEIRESIAILVRLFDIIPEAYGTR